MNYMHCEVKNDRHIKGRGGGVTSWQHQFETIKWLNVLFIGVHLISKYSGQRSECNEGAGCTAELFNLIPHTKLRSGLDQSIIQWRLAEI